MKINRFIFIFSFVGLIMVGSLVNGQNVVFLDDVGVIDITKDPYNADNTGTEDVTAIIQNAVNSVLPGYYRIIYFPEGTYKVSDQIAWGKGQWNQGPVFIGQDRDKTIIKLMDGAEGFGEGQRKGVIFTGHGSADNFNSGIRNLTVNIGSNNPGACGIQYNANNEGLLDNVTITSDDGGGKYGLDMGYTDMIGPLLVRNLLVEGFETGVQIEYAVNSMTLSNITVNNQERYGIYIDNQVVSIENLKSNNSVPAVHLYRGSLTLVNSELTGANANEPAIINGFGGYMYVKGTSTPGYKNAITNFGGNSKSVAGEYVDEFVSHDVLKLYPNTPDTSLNLAIKQPPATSWESDLSKWANIEDYGAVAGDGIDDTQAIQAAIDACTAESGINTICLPNRTRPVNGGADPFTVEGTLTLNEYVKHFIGCAAYIEGDGKILVPENQSDVVKIQNLRRLRGSEFRVEHRGAQPVIVEASVLHSVTGNGTGDIFINDLVCNFITLTNPAQKTWCRQLNMEGDLGPIDRISNDGADLWILGYKTEENGIKIHTMNSGRTELLGYFNYPIKSEKNSPIFIVDNASFTVTGMRQSIGTMYYEYVMEIRGSDTAILRLEDTYDRRIPLFVGYEGEAPEYYTITASAGEGGSIYPSGEVQVSAGSEQTFTITPDVGYEISDVLVDENSVGAVGTYTFTEVSTIHSINASFSEVSSSVRTVKKSWLNIYPVPAKESLNIKFSDIKSFASVHIYNTQGVPVMQREISGDTSLDVSSLSAGIYIISVQSGQKIFHEKIKIMK